MPAHRVGNHYHATADIGQPQTKGGDMVKVKDLHDLVLVTNRVKKSELLFCHECGSEFSASSGDYFMADPNHIFMCCDTEMELVIKQTVYQPSRWA